MNVILNSKKKKTLKKYYSKCQKKIQSTAYQNFLQCFFCCKNNLEKFVFLIKKGTWKVLNFAIFAIFDHFREIFYLQKTSKQEITK